MEHNGVRHDIAIPGAAFLADEHDHPSPPGYEAVVDSGSYFIADLEFGVEAAEPSSQRQKAAQGLGSMCGDCLIAVIPGSSCPHMEVNLTGKVRILG